jgi:hypothetical protein
MRSVKLLSGASNEYEEHFYGNFFLHAALLTDTGAILLTGTEHPLYI